MMSTLNLLITLGIFQTCLSAAGSQASNGLWLDKFSVEEDLDRLAGGDNLLYAVAGSATYILQQLKDVTNKYRAVHHTSIKCLDVSGSENTLREFQHVMAVSDRLGRLGRHIIIVHSFEVLKGEALKKLDFLFRVTDRSSPYANLVIVLLWNKTMYPFELNVAPHHGPQDIAWSLRSYFAEVWSSGGALVNGGALSGRISRIAYEDHSSDILCKS
jgi:hypothetical protein